MIRFFAQHPTVANLLMVAFLAVGAVVAPTLQRATFPRVEADTVQITTRYQGASPQVVEEAICQRVEDAIDGVDNVHEMRCEAREGVAIAQAEMREGGNLDRFFADVRSEIDAIDDFPERAEDPVLEQLGRTDFVASVAIVGPMSRPDLQAFAEDIKARMQAFGGIPEIDVKGFSDRQLRIEIPEAVMRQYGLSLEEIARRIERQNVDLPAGTIETDEGDLLLRMDDERRAADTLANIVVFTDQSGGQVRLGDVATLDDRFEDEEVKILFDGEPAAVLDITKAPSDDTLTVSDRIAQFLDTERARAPPGVEFAVVNDGSTVVRDRLNLLLVNGLQGLALVCLVMWLIFGARYAFWIAAGLPVAFMGGVAAMALLGMTLNMLTMVALLIVVGLLMDDAIVISENIAAEREKGAQPMEAAINGAREVMPGVFASFLTTVCIFGSLAFLQGDLGQLLRVVPIVMIAVLAISLVEAFLILPHHLGHTLSHQRTSALGRAQEFSNGVVERLRGVVGRFSFWCTRFRYLTAGVAFGALILAVSALASGTLKFTPFPELDGDTLEARILLPQGTPLARTEGVVDRVVSAIADIDEEYASEQPGGQLVISTMVEFNENPDAYESGPHVATVAVDVVTSEERTLDNERLFGLWRERVGAVPDVIALKFTEPSIGPAGRPIDLQLKGNDLDALKAASEDLLGWLSGYAGVVDLLDDLRPGKPELDISINREGLLLGLTADDIASQVRAAYFGTTVDEVQVGRQDYEIDVRIAAPDRASIATLDDFRVAAPSGALVPLISVATVEPDRGFARVNRIDGVRTVSVQGDVDSRVANAAEVIDDTMTRFVPGFLERHPGVSLTVSGQDEESATTQQSMLRGFGLGLVGVFLILSFQFRSFAEPFVVMIVIPFAFIGAVSGHMLLGIDFTLPSMLGFAALSGVVVNDSILLVQRIKEHHDPGGTIADAAPKAAAARFRAILLTSLTTVAGLLPLLLETSLQAQVLVPLVASLAFGLMAATVLVLFVVPAIYAILDDFGVTTLAAERRALAHAPAGAD